MPRPRLAQIFGVSLKPVSSWTKTWVVPEDESMRTEGVELKEFSAAGSCRRGCHALRHAHGKTNFRLHTSSFAGGGSTTNLRPSKITKATSTTTTNTAMLCTEITSAANIYLLHALYIALSLDCLIQVLLSFTFYEISDLQHHELRGRWILIDEQQLWRAFLRSAIHFVLWLACAAQLESDGVVPSNRDHGIFAPLGHW